MLIRRRLSNWPNVDVPGPVLLTCEALRHFNRAARHIPLLHSHTHLLQRLCSLHPRIPIQVAIAIASSALRILPTMADDDSSSDLSSLPSLSPPPSGEDEEIELKRDNKGILKFFQKVPASEAAEARKSPTPRKREPSPPHEPVFADNPAIAVSFLRVVIATKREKARSFALAQLGLTRPTVHCHVSQAI